MAKAKKIVSYILVVCMLSSGILVNLPTMNVFGAAQTEATVDNARKHVYGNGFPLLIMEDGLGNTKIYQDVNKNDEYDVGTDTEIVVTGNISEYWIFGGGKNITVASTKITMTSGKVGVIVGGGYANGTGLGDANVTGDININITNGIAGGITGGGYCLYTEDKVDVGGTININIEGKMECSRLIGGASGNSDSQNVNKVMPTVHDINISINNVANGKLYIMYGSGSKCNQIGNTNISIKNSSFSNNDIRNAIYGGIEGIGEAGWLETEKPKKAGDVSITLDNVTFGSDNKYDVYGGGYLSGNDGNVAITIKDTNNIKNIWGAGYAAHNSDGNISKNVTINVLGNTSIGSSIYAGGHSAEGISAYVKEKASIDISGTTSVYGVQGSGQSSLTAVDVSVKGGSKVYISGDPSIGLNSSLGIDLSTFDDNKVIVNGELTGSTAKIGLKNASATTSGTVLVTFGSEITVNKSVFSYAYAMGVNGNNVIIDKRNLTLNSRVTGINGVPISSTTGSLQPTDDSFTGISVGDDITSWFSDAMDLGITVKVTNVSASLLQFSFTGTPNKSKTKTFITITVPKEKLLSGISKQVTSTGNGYWEFRNPEKYDVTHTLTNITSTSGTAGIEKISEGTAYTTTLTPDSGYKLPRQIEVMVGGIKKYGSIYNKATGEVTIPGTLTINGGNVEIIAKAVEEDAIDYYLKFDTDSKKLYDEDGNEYKEQLDKWSVDSKGNLVLNGFEFTTSSSYGLYLTSDTKIILAKDSVNTIKCTGDNYFYSVIYVEEKNSDNFTIEGSGILNLELDGSPTYAYGFLSDVDTYIKDVTLNINKVDSSSILNALGAYIAGNLFITNSDVLIKIDDTDTLTGIDVYENININDSLVEVSTNVQGKGVNSYSGDIIINSNAKLIIPDKGIIDKDGTNTTIFDEDGKIASNIKIISNTAKYFVSQELTNITAAKDSIGTRKAIAGSDYTTTLTAAKCYKLPSSITIKINGTALSTGDYTYDSSTGKVKILAAKVTGEVIIKASGEVIKDNNDDNGNNNNAGNDNGNNNNDGDDNGGNDNGGDNNGNNNGSNNGSNHGNNNNEDDNKSELGDVKKEINKDEKAPEMSLNNKLKELENLIFTEEEKALIRNGAKAKIYLEVKDISSTISDADKVAIQEGIADFIIGEYIDISLFKRIGGGVAQRVSNPNGLISITIIMPESLRVTDESKTRNYKIARMHDGELTIIDGVYDSATGEFTFETDKFSTYAIIYEEVDVVDSTDNNGSIKTGDSSHLWLWMLLAAGAMGVEIISASRKKEKVN